MDNAAMTADHAGLPVESASGRAGFTLIEVLIALAISGLCLMTLSGIVGRLATARRAIDDHAAVVDQAAAIVRVLRNLLGSVDVEMKGAESPNVSGRSGELIVRSQGPAVLDLEAETTFRLHFVPAGDPAPGASGTLALAWTNPTTGMFYDETIATGVTALRLAYEGTGRREGWVGDWTRPVADLALVKVEIAFAGLASATSAVVAVGTKLPQPCVVDPMLERCPQW